MRFLVAVIFSGICAAPAAALDVEFNGVVATTCTLALGTPGTLALSASGTILGSEEGVAVPATVTILSIGANTIDVAAPIRISADPPGYQAGTEVLEVSYAGAGGLSLISQAYTSLATDFPASNIPLSVLTVNNRITNSAGFAAGTYTTRTVITCS